MENFTVTLGKSVVTMGIMLLYYVLFLRNRKLYSFNRFYLLGTLLVGLLVPFFHFSWYIVGEASVAPAIEVVDAIRSGGGEEFYVGANEKMFHIRDVGYLLYGLVSLVLLVKTIRRVVSLYQLKRISWVTKYEGYECIHTDHPNAPFSFLNKLFWNDAIDTESETGKQVLAHELTHIRQWHTVDKLLVQFVMIVCWVNPFVWYIRHELSLTHEFLADDQAVANGDTSAFAAMLLSSHYKVALSSIVNPFYSPIKRRMIMLTNNKSIRYARLRKAAVVPLLLIPVLLFSFTIKNKEDVVVHNKNHKMTLILDAGHGGRDAGARCKNGVCEKEMNLKICKVLARIAEKYDLNVVQTRPDDGYPTLMERVAKANEIENAVFVSVHVNKSNPEVITKDGMKVYAHKAPEGFEIDVATKSELHDESKVLASAILQQLKGSGRKTTFSERGLIVLRNNHPAVLIEFGDIDNPSDMAKLADDEWIERSCGDILSGVVKYINAKGTEE